MNTPFVVKRGDSLSYKMTIQSLPFPIYVDYCIYSSLQKHEDVNNLVSACVMGVWFNDDQRTYTKRYACEIYWPMFSNSINYSTLNGEQNWEESTKESTNYD